MNYVKICTLCRSRELKKVHQKGEWKYMECLHCGLVSLSPRPDQYFLREMYENYLPSDRAKIRDWYRMLEPIIHRSADEIESQRGDEGPGRILDIGSGYGFFLAEMKSRGWDVEGIEISEAGRHYSRDTLSIPVHGTSLRTLHLPENSFDAVSLIYVIEHILDPVGHMGEVSRILRPGGLVLLRWPHTTPLIKLLGPLGSLGDFYHTPYHIYDYSPSAMERLLKCSGFAGCSTLPGGFSLPKDLPARMCSAFLGKVGEILFQKSQGRLLLPGISKTTVALKES